jgi:hypothetical protein
VITSGGWRAERRVRNVHNVKDYGATGDGVTNDAAAIDAAVAALTDDSMLVFPPGQYLYSKTSSASNVAGAIKLDGLDRVAVVFDPAAELVLDTLTGGGGTGTRHGLLVHGSCSDVWVENVTLRWNPAPTARTLGDGFRFLGYPSDSAPGGGWTTTTGKVQNVHLINCTTVAAPQTGAIFMGCSDVRVVNFRAESTKADSLHFNACRRVNIDGVTAVDCGDDSLAFVTYYHATDIPEAAEGPFAQPSLGEWSNFNSSARGVVSHGSLANGVRVSGSLNVTVTGVSVDAPAASGVLIDGGQADGSHIWSYQASRGIVVGDVSVTSPDTGVLVEAFNAGSGVNSRFWAFDVRISNVVVRDSGNRPLRVQGDGSSTGIITGVSVSGVRGYAATNKQMSLAGARDCSIVDVYNEGDIAIYGEQTVFSGALSGLARHNIAVGNLFANGGTILLQDLRGVTAGTLKSASSQSDGIIMNRVKEMTAGTMSIVLPNRGNSGTVRALLLNTVQQLTVGDFEVTHDGNTTTSFRSLEIGGGDATNVSTDIIVERGIYRNTINQSDSDVVLQGGTYAPTNYIYDLRFFNGGEASPVWRRERRGSTAWPEVFIGAGTPEGAVTAPVGSSFARTDGGAATSQYVKESGSSNTGWVGK